MEEPFFRGRKLEYSMPIRIRWDVDFRGFAGRAKRIARQIREAAPLIVELRIEGQRGLSDLSAVFTEIHKCNPCIEATVRLSPKAVDAAQRGYPIDFIWEVSVREPFRELLPSKVKEISFTPDKNTLDDLPDVLEEFAGSGLECLRLPNVNAVRALAEKGHVPVPTPDKLRTASEKIARLDVSLEGKRLVVHDYFLWKSLRNAFPREAGERVEFSGCQAGSALAYVDWEGNVYPCDSLPIRLGSLKETSFEKVWRSPAREQVLAAIRSLPATCGSCGLSKGCLAGCRGMAYSARGTLDSPDPSCPDEGAAPTGGSSPAR